MEGVAEVLRNTGILTLMEGGMQPIPNGEEEPQPTKSLTASSNKPLGLCATHQSDPELETHSKEAHICAICAKNEARRKLEANKQAFQSMQVGLRFQGFQWRDYEAVCEEAGKNRDFLKNFAQNFGDALERGSNGILMGRPGTGKNMLAALMCKTLAASGHTALHTTVAKLVDRIRETWHPKSEEMGSQVYQKLAEPELLVIDEVGVQSGSPNEIHILTRVINDRYVAKRPVLLLTNLDFTQMEALLGERIMDRFCEEGSFVLEFNWGSYRRRHLKNNC